MLSVMDEGFYENSEILDSSKFHTEKISALLLFPMGLKVYITAIILMAVGC